MEQELKQKLGADRVIFLGMTGNRRYYCAIFCNSTDPLARVKAAQRTVGGTFEEISENRFQLEFEITASISEQNKPMLPGMTKLRQEISDRINYRLDLISALISECNPARQEEIRSILLEIRNAPEQALEKVYNNLI